MVNIPNFNPEEGLIKKIIFDVESNVHKYKIRRIFGKWILIIGVVFNVIFIISYGIKYLFYSSSSELPSWFSLLLMFIPYFGVVLNNKSNKKEQHFRSNLQRIRSSTKMGQEVKYLIDNHKQFGFYLRDFSSGQFNEKKIPISGGLTGISNPINWEVSYGNSTSNSVIEYFNNHMPITYLNNVGEMTIIDSGLTIYSSDETWVSYFIALAENARFIIIEYDLNKIHGIDGLSNNIKFEIEYLISKVKKNIIFIGTEDEKYYVKNKYPDLWNLVICYCIKSKILDNFSHEIVDFSNFEKISSKNQ